MLAIRLATCTCDNRVVDKTGSIIYAPVYTNCDVYHECDVMNPTFLLAYNSSIVNYNYLVVESWSRYYFITGVTVAPGGRIYISCKEDVLMSNKDEILELTAYASRSQSSQEHYLIDEKVPSLITIFRTHTTFDATFNDTGFNYLLTVKGGKLASN